MKRPNWIPKWVSWPLLVFIAFIILLLCVGENNYMRIYDYERQINELKAEIKTLSELKSPQELKAAAEYSARGFRAVLFGEKAFRTDIVVFVASVVVALLIPVSWCERALMVYSVFMALIAEIANTAIETVVDRISLERNELSGKAKDTKYVLLCYSGNRYANAGAANLRALGVSNDQIIVLTGGAKAYEL